MKSTRISRISFTEASRLSSWSDNGFSAKGPTCPGRHHGVTLSIPTSIVVGLGTNTEGVGCAKVMTVTEVINGQKPGQLTKVTPHEEEAGTPYCRCVGGSVDPWPSITVPNSVALCGGMTVLSATM